MRRTISLPGTFGSRMVHWLPQELQHSHPFNVHAQPLKASIPRRETRVSTMVGRMAPTIVAPTVVAHTGNCKGSKGLDTGSLMARSRVVTEAGTATCPFSEGNLSRVEGAFAIHVPLNPRPSSR